MLYGAEAHPKMPASFCSGLIWEDLVSSDPELADSVAACTECLVLRGTPRDSSTLDYLRDAVGLISYLLDNGGCAVYDPFALRWWRPALWKQELFDAGEPVPRDHTVILVSQEGDPALKWFHTRGMRNFGRRDVSVHGVPADREDDIVDLCNRLIEYPALGHVVSDGQEIQIKSLPTGGIMQHAGDVEEPDFNNAHLEVTWPNRELTRRIT